MAPQGAKRERAPFHHPYVERVVRRMEEDKEVKAIILFGSLAKGKGRKNSDVDLAVVGGGRWEAYSVKGVVDIVDLLSAPLPLAYRILKEGTVIHQKGPIRHLLSPLYRAIAFHMPLWRRHGHV